MGDAEIIPIGTRGRPGRGTGKQPSSAARNLAGGKGPAARPATRRTPDTDEAQPTDVAVDGAEDTAEDRAETTGVQDAPPASTDAPTVGDPPEASRPAARTRERHARGGIPAADLMAAFQVAAREVFGEEWEVQLARFLAFLRRRVTGDYSVDEYGFDQEISQRFFMAALSRTSRARAVPSSCPTTPARCRSTA